MANKSCTVRMYCKMLFAGSDSEGDICGLEMTIGRLMIGTSLPRIAIVFTKHKQVIISALYPTGMGGGGAGVDVVLVSIGEADDRTRLRRLF